MRATTCVEREARYGEWVDCTFDFNHDGPHSYDVPWEGKSASERGAAAVTVALVFLGGATAYVLGNVLVWAITK